MNKRRQEIEVFPASKWNRFGDDVRRAFPYRGDRCRLSQRSQSDGFVIESTAAEDFRHPWRVSCVWEFYPPEKQTERRRGSWRARIEPGFVNGRDVYISTTIDGAPADLALTDDPEPTLELTDWRNPLGPGGVDSAAALESGSLTFQAGEGYPPFFESLGVRPASKGGTGLAALQAENVPGRDRELRAIDLVLNTPRLGSALDVTTLDPFSTGFTHQLGTTFTNSNFVSKKGRSFIRSTSKFRPFDAGFVNSPLLGLPMFAGDPQFEEIKLATVYIVSPPGVGSEAEPDETWEPYPKHDVFWNLAFATRFNPPGPTLEPLRISTGLGAGLLDWLGNALLSPINSMMDEAGKFLNQSDMRGRFWDL